MYPEILVRLKECLNSLANLLKLSFGKCGSVLYGMILKINALIFLINFSFFYFSSHHHCQHHHSYFWLKFSFFFFLHLTTKLRHKQAFYLFFFSSSLFVSLYLKKKKKFIFLLIYVSAFIQKTKKNKRIFVEISLKK